MNRLPLALLAAAAGCAWLRPAPAPRDGWELVLRPPAAAAGTEEREARRLAEIARWRLDEAGFTEAALRREPGGRLAVFLPAARGAERQAVLELLSAPGRLECREVVGDPLAVARALNRPAGATPAPQRLLPAPGPQGPISLLVDFAAEPLFSGPDVAEVELFLLAGRPALRLILAPGRGARLAECTGRAEATQLALFCDGRIVSAPLVQGRLTDRLLLIAPGDLAANRRLAAVLRSASLPGGLVLEEERRILPPPTPGADSPAQAPPAPEAAP